MADEKRPKDEVDDVEIEPLADEDLEDVAGGAKGSSDGCCSCANCSAAN